MGRLESSNLFSCSTEILERQQFLRAAWRAGQNRAEAPRIGQPNHSVQPITLWMGWWASLISGADVATDSEVSAMTKLNGRKD